MKLELRKIGNSTGVILPRELLIRLGLSEGDAVYATIEDKKLLLQGSDETFVRGMAIAEDLMDRYKHALAELAK